MRTAVGHPSASQRSKITESQPAYSVSPSAARGGGSSQVAWGSRKSIRGGRSSINASYTAIGSFATSIVHSRPA